MNAVVQCVLQMEGPMNALSQAKSRLHSQPATENVSMADALLLLRDAWEARRGRYVPRSDPALKSLTAALSRHGGPTNPAQQQDASHFLMLLFDSIEDTLLRAQQSSLDESVSVTMQRVMGCRACGLSSYPQTYRWRMVLVNVDADASTDASASTPVPLSTLIRAQFGTPVSMHLTCEVCAHVFDASDRVLHECYHWTGVAEHLVIGINHWKSPSEKNSRSVICPQHLAVQDSIYVLRSSVGHFGDNPNMGHFTTVVHNNADKLCYTCNDHIVSGGHQRISLTRREDGAPTAFSEGVTPYILFYQKIGVELPPQVPVSQTGHPPIRQTGAACRRLTRNTSSKG